MRAAGEYLESLRDHRVVHYRGRRIEDVTKEPDLRVAIDMACIDFELAEDPTYRDALVVEDRDAGGRVPLLYRIPRSPEEILARCRAIELTTAHAACIPPLIKEIIFRN